jgi:DNA-binding transcriptional MerR regulator
MIKPGFVKLHRAVYCCRGASLSYFIVFAFRVAGRSINGIQEKEMSHSEGMFVKDYLSVSAMAKIHNISRQTLIYYDKIALFKPEHTEANGYRLYNPSQIPLLREICFLKSVGIKLEDIKRHIEQRNLTTATSLLEYHKEFINKEISNLVKTREFIQHRLSLYKNADYARHELYKPVIEELPERKALFVSFEKEISNQELRFTLMKAWNIMRQYDMIPSNGFGTRILRNQLAEDDIFKGAGIFVYLPGTDQHMENSITLPAGQYACMYKYAMPYETADLFKLMKWISDNNYKITGDVIDACLLDATFYTDGKTADFCQIQIPVEKKPPC